MNARHSQTETLAWLAENWPELHAAAELDRDWLWLVVDLRANEAARLALKGYGFRFARRGHPLPGGKVGTWGCSCLRPLPFGRKRTTNQPARELTDDEMLAAVGL